MIDIKILTRDLNSFFEQDSIYSAVMCKDDETGIKDSLVQWKDMSDENICGLLTGGMYFIHQEQPICESFIESNLEHYRLILPYEEALTEVLGKYDYTYEDYINQSSRLVDEISFRYPELEEGIKKSISGKYYIRPNIIIGYIGDIRELYKYIDGIDICRNNPLMTSLVIKGWVITKGFRVRTLSISNNSPEIWNCGYQKISIIQNYVSVVLKDYIIFRKSEGFIDSFAGENPYQGNFDGKKPIWVCWWQGEAEMPDLIKACVASVNRNAPDNTTVILITMSNVKEYVTFTDSIIDKFNSGKISLTHLSDILRAELIYRYGGMWIDATYYIPHIISKLYFEDRLFSIAFSKPLWGMDIMRGRWTLSVLGAERKNPAVQFLMEGLWFYWDNCDDIVDYFLVDYIFDAGYRSFDIIRSDIDSIRRSSNAVYDLQLKMNQSCDDRDLQWIQTAADFFKLNRRNEYSLESIADNRTFYSYIVNAGNKVNCKEEKDICIGCSSYIDFVKKIRAFNPKKILDYSNYLIKDGRISKGILSDYLYDSCVIDAYKGENGCANNYDYIFNSMVDVPECIRSRIEKMLNSMCNGVYLMVLGNYTEYDLLIVEK